jgi:hypothetical protein
LNTWRKILCDELLAMPPRVRDKAAIERQQNLTFSIKLIDFGFAANRLRAPIISLESTRVGELMVEAGYDVVGLELLRGPNGFRGSLPDTEQRIKDLTKQRTEAQAALDVLLRTDEERAQQEAEDNAFHEAINTMDLAHGADGQSLVAFTKDGDVLPYLT